MIYLGIYFFLKQQHICFWIIQLIEEAIGRIVAKTIIDGRSPTSSISVSEWESPLGAESVELNLIITDSVYPSFLRCLKDSFRCWKTSLLCTRETPRSYLYPSSIKLYTYSSLQSPNAFSMLPYVKCTCIFMGIMNTLNVLDARPVNDDDYESGKLTLIAG